MNKLEKFQCTHMRDNSQCTRTTYDKQKLCSKHKISNMPLHSCLMCGKLSKSQYIDICTQCNKKNLVARCRHLKKLEQILNGNT